MMEFENQYLEVCIFFLQKLFYNRYFFFLFFILDLFTPEMSA